MRTEQQKRRSGTGNEDVCPGLKPRLSSRSGPQVMHALPAGHACLSPVLMYKSCPGRFKTWPRQRIFPASRSRPRTPLSRARKLFCNPEYRSSKRRCTYSQASGNWDSRKAIFCIVVVHLSGGSRLLDHILNYCEINAKFVESLRPL